ncbi:MAG: bifunctional enoyl-CoA hydratase/phosphate acetyltransferase [Gammaproteobacteria bacterium]|nr:bifunctional enoyl-CoA hydratase/phosphate acetyltransferase [Gammaproteobacteria bacterium]MCP5423704.1 bifunctional enoyl-CoA hydratase/phosphate acetyltransferase [Gammaproteobacteria bacterium]
MECLENRTYDEIRIGDSASSIRTLSQRDFELFALLAGGDPNPSHLDEVYATEDMLHEVVAPSLWSGALISWVVGTRLPGPGSRYRGHNLHVHKAMGVGDTLKVSVTVIGKHPQDHSVSLDCVCLDQAGERVLSGTIWIVAPEHKICSPPVELPVVHFEEHGARHKKLVEMTAQLEPIATAVVHPVDPVSLGGTVRAAQARLIQPLLIGPAGKIRAAADEAGIDITPFELLDVPHSHAAAAKAVDLARAGQVGIIKKGSLHTDELMAEVVRSTCGLRTERRISHVFVMDVPTYPKPLLITDSAVNIDPDLLDKRDIIQNAIDLAQVMGVERPKVAILSAVETVTPKLKATMDAAALCKMADRGQIVGGILDGPLAFDNAISKKAALTKGIQSPVAGDADILLVPDLEAGNMLSKQLIYLSNAAAAGIVLGARVPIVLTSRADGDLERMASCAVAVLMVHRKLKTLRGA